MVAHLPDGILYLLSFSTIDKVELMASRFYAQPLPSHHQDAALFLLFFL
jgi:hypothetical protein